MHKVAELRVRVRAPHIRCVRTPHHTERERERERERDRASVKRGLQTRKTAHLRAPKIFSDLHTAHAKRLALGSFTRTARLGVQQHAYLRAVTGRVLLFFFLNMSFF